MAASASRKVIFAALAGRRSAEAGDAILHRSNDASGQFVADADKLDKRSKDAYMAPMALNFPKAARVFHLATVKTKNIIGRVGGRR